MSKKGVLWANNHPFQFSPFFSFLSLLFRPALTCRMDGNDERKERDTEKNWSVGSVETKRKKNKALEYSEEKKHMH